MAPTFSYGQVSARAERVLILATGESVKEVPLDALARVSPAVHIIGVNGAIEWAPRLDSWATIDMDYRNRQRVKEPRAGLVYYACVPNDFGNPKARHIAHRAPAEPHITYLRQVGPQAGKSSRYPLAEDPGACSLGNSTYGALNVAYHMKPKRVVILGLDGGGGYAHNVGKPGRLNHLRILFLMATKQVHKAGIQLVVGNPRSIVRCWPTLRPNDALAWIER